MNVRLQYNFDFLAGLYFEGQLQLNQYAVCISLLTKTANSADTNVAMGRIKVFVNEQLANTIFINSNDRERAELFQLMGINVTTIPEQPVDQIIGMMLYCKFNAIMDGRMIITQLDISSQLGDGIWYQHDDEDSSGPFVAQGWWHDCTLQHSMLTHAESDTNVVKVISDGWHDYELRWPEERTEIDSIISNTVVFGKFPKNEN